MLKEFKEYDLEAYLGTLFETLILDDEEQGEDSPQNLQDAYMRYAIDAMHDSVRTTASTENIIPLNWVIPVSGRPDPLHIWAYHVDDTNQVIDVFVSAFFGYNTLAHYEPVRMKTLINSAINRLGRFYVRKNTPDSFDLSIELFLEELRSKKYGRVNLVVITDAVCQARDFKPHNLDPNEEIFFYPQCFDLSTLYSVTLGNHTDDLIVDFTADCGALDAVVIQGNKTNCYLTALPANILQKMYTIYGQRLLGENVRSFLTFKSKVNQNIATTLNEEPDNFINYNNGLVIVAEKVSFTEDPASHRIRITGLQGPQIVNGGQTTVSIARSKSADIASAWVEAKIIDISKSLSEENNGSVEERSDEIETIIQKISKAANTQNKINDSDLSSNLPWNKKLKDISQNVTMRDNTHWFFERTKGSYATTISELKTKKEKELYPKSQKLNKADVAVCMYAWEGRPDIAAKGNEKCYDYFMRNYVNATVIDSLDHAMFRTIVAKHMLFTEIPKIARKKKIFPHHKQSAAYLLALIAKKYGNGFNFDNIWVQQRVSDQMLAQLEIWFEEFVSLVKSNASESANLSEWLKTEKCWKVLSKHNLSAPVSPSIPELQPKN